MAYYFMSEVSKGKYRQLNISNSKYFQDINRSYNKPCAYTLEEIDKFTMMFDNEIELRERLVEEGILALSLFERPLSIRYLQKEQYSKVPYDFLLIKKIISRFSEDYKCSSTLPEVRQHLEASIRDGEINKHFDDLDENNDKLLPRLLKLIIIESFNTKSGKTIYKDKIRYRNLHTLIALINYYDKEEELDKEPTFKSVEKDLENGNPPIFTVSDQRKTQEKEYQFVKTRTLGKKKHTLEKQISFDI